MNTRLVLSFLIAVTAARAATFYCDPIHGSREGDGSSTRPWRTIEEVLQARRIQLRDRGGQPANPEAPVKPGDTVLLRSGWHGVIRIAGGYNDQFITVEKNVVCVSHWHGITLGDAQGCSIQDNVCFSRWSRRARPWVQLGQKKNQAAGNTVRNNFAHSFDFKADAAVKAENNQEVTEAVFNQRLGELARDIDRRFGERHPAAKRPRLESAPARTSLTVLAESFPVSIRVDAGKSQGDLQPIWRFFGADEPNYAYMKHGRRLMGELGALAPDRIFFRTHNLLTSGDGTPALKWGSTGAYREDATGTPVYDWTILDRIFDAYREHGVRPYVQIGFMPKDLSVKPKPYQHSWTPEAAYDQIYTGWAYPPKDYARWAELVFQWTQHCRERYGRSEVESWYWEVWNEPNIGYWRGTPAEFHQLHDYAIDAVRRALPTARVGGPDVAGSGGKFMRDFLDHCLRATNYATGQIGTPLDFVSFHAKGAPITTNGHVRMGIRQHLATIEEGFRIVASYPELQGKPIVIGESDPEGCAACQGPSLAYRNGTMYSSYTAASFARKHDLAEKYGVNLEGALTWAFEFEDQPYFASFRSLASNGIDKPVLNLLEWEGKTNGVRSILLTKQNDPESFPAWRGHGEFR